MSAAPCLVDGVPADRSAADAALASGDGLVETMAVVAGRIRLLDRHLQRLARGCARLGLDPPDAAVLDAELAAGAAAPGAAVLRLALARGADGRGSRRVLEAGGPRERPAGWWRDGVVVHRCATRWTRPAAFAGLKHLDRRELKAARAEWQDPAIAEGVLLDVHGRVVCGTMTNVFAVVDNQLVTPDPDDGGVAGVMRAALLDAWRAAGREVAVGGLDAKALDRADEIFLTNALIGAWPVRRLGERSLEPGPLVREAQAFVAGFCT